jgi:hypothetical protein
VIPAAAAPALEAPLGTAEALRRYRLAALLCAGLLLVGYLRTAPGAAFTAPWGYRGWSFQQLAYSDVLALHTDRGAGRHPLPYLADRIEYPVLLGLAMWLPSLVAPGMLGYFTLTYLAVALSALGVLWLLCRQRGSAALIFAASPALVVYAPLNWDLLGALPLLLGLHAWSRQREREAALWLSLAACTKVFPLLALWLLLACATRRGARHALSLAGLSLLVALAVNLPFALAGQTARENWAWFFTYSRIREIEPSLYTLLGASPRGFVAQANAISSGAVAAAALLLGALELRTRRLPVRPALLLLLCVFFLANKVYSPQYWLWVVVALAWAGAPAALGVLASATALVDYLCSFTHLHLQLARVGDLLVWFQQHLFWPMVATRYAVLASCAAWALWQLRAEPLRLPAALGYKGPDPEDVNVGARGAHSP